MAHDWLADAQTALVGAVDRVVLSEVRITELLDTTIDPVTLPTRPTRAVAGRHTRHPAGLPAGGRRSNLVRPASSRTAT